MSWKHLGETFDIHGGGVDLVFPHHENEIAQSCCAFGLDVMARYWMHNGFLQVEGEKMSKSLGNFVTIHELLHTEKFGGRSWPGPVLRLAMLRTHYRQPIDWTVKALEEAEATLRDWAEYAGRLKVGLGPAAATAPDERVISALSDDLNTPAALAELFGLARAARGGDFAAGQALAGTAEFLGFNTLDWFSAQETDEALKSMVEAYIDKRLAARAAKNWAESDRIRDELAAMGVALKDNKDGTTTWEAKR
jgi:cysteinyl-tRNA synthetase